MSVPEVALPASRLLAALPRAARDKFVSRCDVIVLEFEEVLALPGAEIEHVYFPLDSYISQLTPVAGPLECGQVPSREGEVDRHHRLAACMVDVGRRLVGEPYAADIEVRRVALHELEKAIAENQPGIRSPST